MEKARKRVSTKPMQRSEAEAQEVTGSNLDEHPLLSDRTISVEDSLQIRLVWIQEVIVSAAVLGAGVGSAIGGWFSDQVGRKKALLVGDVLFTLGALLMAAAGSPNALIAAVPSVLQFAGLLFLPESPKWLASKGQHEAAEQALRSLRGPDQIEADLAEMQAAAEEESKARSWALLRSPVVRSELQVGLGLQILQQLGGINTVMYYTPAILELAGLRDNRTALLVAMLPAAVKKLMLSSMAGVVIALLLLGYAFHLAEGDSPQVTPGASTTCPAPDCAACLHQACIFCGSKDDPMLPGFCIASDKQCSAAAQGQQELQPYSSGCPSHYNWLIVGALMLYLAAFSPGMGPVPWAVNAEIYPVQLRGLGGGAAATCNWITNAVVSQTFLTLIQHLGGSGTFWLYAVIALSGAVWVSSALPETNGEQSPIMITFSPK
ncbi:MAG: putative inositol transporter 2-like [Trebouxia sp. A1-2]|nr:MAG: putative inositol transporter 2-like [Trebouxia sp. A1-2]